MSFRSMFVRIILGALVVTFVPAAEARCVVDVALGNSVRARWDEACVASMRARPDSTVPSSSVFPSRKVDHPQQQDILAVDRAQSLAHRCRGARGWSE